LWWVGVFDGFLVNLYGVMVVVGMLDVEVVVV